MEREREGERLQPGKKRRRRRRKGELQEPGYRFLGMVEPKMELDFIS